MSLLSLVQRYKQFDFTGFVPVKVHDDKGGRVTVGWTKESTARVMAGLDMSWDFGMDGLLLKATFDNYQKRTDAVDATLLAASASGVLPEKPDYEALGMGPDDWMTAGPRLRPLFELRRFYTPYMGIRRYNSRLNAYDDDQMWVVKRGAKVHINPGKLDNLVGAGQVAGRTIHEHLLVEAHEEAGLQEADCRDITSVSMFHVMRANGQGFLVDEINYVYDLDTRGRVTPHVVQHWETETIFSWPWDKVLDVMKNTDDFMPEARLCLIDFFMRKGVITPDNEPDYDALAFGLRSVLDYPTYNASYAQGQG